MVNGKSLKAVGGQSSEAVSYQLSAFSFERAGGEFLSG
jgi:hypothetical protein